MARKIFVNFPVKDLKQSMLFFAQLGFHFDPAFTDDKAACMIVAEESFVMLLEQQFFQSFTSKPISDAHHTVEVIVAISAESRAAVDQFVDQALLIGGLPSGDPQDHGFMYSRSFQDLEGHIWEVVWMQADIMVQ